MARPVHPGRPVWLGACLLAGLLAAAPGPAAARPTALEMLGGSPDAPPPAKAPALAPAVAPVPAPVPGAVPTAAARPAGPPIPAAAGPTAPVSGPASAARPAVTLAAEAAAGAGATGLPALLARVLADDPQVRVATFALQAAESRQRQARSRLGPSVTLSSVVGRSVDEEAGLREVSRDTRRSEAGLRWNLLNQGQDLAELRGATRDRLAAAAELRRAREEAAERLAQAWLERQRLDALLPRAQERLDALRRLAGQLRRQAEGGKAAEADLLQAEASLADAEIVRDQLEADARSARARLDRLAGQPVGSLQPFDWADADPASAPGSAAAAADDSPQPGQLLAAEARAAAAQGRVRPAASWLAPRVDLELRHQLANTTRPALSTEQQQGWLLSARWDLPLGGELPARLAEQQQRAQAAEADADRVRREVLAELDALAPRIDQARQALASLTRQIGRYDGLVRAAELQFEAGRRSLAQLMQLHDSRFSVEQRLADARQRLLGAQLRQRLLQGRLLPALGLEP